MDGDKPAKKVRFVKTAGQHASLDEASRLAHLEPISGACPAIGAYQIDFSSAFGALTVWNSGRTQLAGARDDPSRRSAAAGALSPAVTGF